MARILIVDDEPQIRAMLRQMFERENHEVVDAPDGKIAMRLQAEKPADIVITDIIMPEKEGLETIMELRRQYPDVHIIAISGGGRNQPKDYLNLAKKLGAVRTFPKPIERSEMLGAVRELLS